MTKEEWLTKARDQIEPLKSLIGNYHDILSSSVASQILNRSGKAEPRYQEVRKGGGLS